MNTFTALAVLILILATVVVLLERSSRRTAGLPRAPFGVDAEADPDLRRVLHDLDARRWD